MIRPAFRVALVAMACCVARAASAAPPIETRVDPRLELVTIVARLAGFAEFNMPNSASPYAEAVERHFGPHRDHPAVVGLKMLRAMNGVSYDAIPSFAMHLDDVATLGERIPFDAPPERLDARWTPIGARTFLEQLRDFARVTDAAAFFDTQRPFYDEVARRLHTRLAASPAIAWFDDFFGARPQARYIAIAGLLCGGGAFGVGVRFADGTPEEITPVFGCWEWDADGYSVFGEAYLPLFIHELCHTYTNPIVDRFEEQLRPAGEAIFATCEDVMRRQAYGNWKTVMYESLVRACVIRCLAATDSADAASAQAADDVERHFRWVPDFALWLLQYENERATYPTFDAFMPRVVEFFDAYSVGLREVEDRRPRVVSMSPANGATDVDPATAALVIVFDRPMRDKSWSLVGGGPAFPELAGDIAYDAARTTLTVPVRLQPAHTYHFGLNGGKNMSFVSAGGVPLAPVEVTFTTRE